MLIFNFLGLIFYVMLLSDLSDYLHSAHSVRTLLQSYFSFVLPFHSFAFIEVVILVFANARAKFENIEFLTAFKHKFDIPEQKLSV